MASDNISLLTSHPQLYGLFLTYDSNKQQKLLKSDMSLMLYWYYEIIQ